MATNKDPEFLTYLDENKDKLWDLFVENIAYDNDCQRHKSMVLNSERCFEEFCEQQFDKYCESKR
jgi:hypothetical protein